MGRMPASRKSPVSDSKSFSSEKTGNVVVDYIRQQRETLGFGDGQDFPGAIILISKQGPSRSIPKVSGEAARLSENRLPMNSGTPSFVCIRWSKAGLTISWRLIDAGRGGGKLGLTDPVFE